MRKNRIKRHCQVCNKVFYTIPSLIKRGYGKFCSRECFFVYLKVAFLGKNNPAYGITRPDLVILNKSRVGIPIQEKSKRKQRISILKYWQSPEGLTQKKKLSLINKQWAKEHPQQKIDSAKKGQKSCPRISSIELKVKKWLESLDISFVSQCEWEQGFMDFFIPPNIVIFVDGDYWHSSQKAKNRDLKQELLLGFKGYTILRLTETDINKHPRKCVNKIKKIENLYFKGVLDPLYNKQAVKNLASGIGNALSITN